MSQNQLDLTIHGINEIAGKILPLNGVSYIIHDLVHEGDETLIFPLENQTSGLILFLAKIYKFKPDSPEFEQQKFQGYYTGFIFNMIGLPTAHLEQYEIAGGIIKFQPHMPEVLFVSSRNVRQAAPVPVTQRSYQDLIDRVSVLIKDRQKEAAISLLEEILSRNPEHSVALLMLGEIYYQSGNPEQVINIVNKALSIEPNDTRLYHLAAKSYIDLVEPQAALSVLNLALERYWWEWESWDLKREVATRFALTDLLKEMEEEAQRRLDRMEAANEKMRANVASDFSLRIELTDLFYQELDQARDLSKSLELLIQTLSTHDPEKMVQLKFRNGQEALRLVTKWQDCWLGRIIAVLSNIFVLETTAAIEVYGGMEGLSQVLESESVEGHYMQGVNAIFRGDREQVLPQFRAAANLDPEDAFVQFGLVIGLMIGGNSAQETADAMTKLRSSHSNHPITNLAAELIKTVRFR